MRDMTITPDVAAQMLTFARSVEGDNDPTKVELYVQLMREGRWTDMTLDLGGAGCPIVWDESGFLRFGMQRLEACVRSGVPIRAVVVSWPRVAS